MNFIENVQHWVNLINNDRFNWLYQSFLTILDRFWHFHHHFQSFNQHFLRKQIHFFDKSLNDIENRLILIVNDGILTPSIQFWCRILNGTDFDFQIRTCLNPNCGLSLVWGERWAIQDDWLSTLKMTNWYFEDDQLVLWRWPTGTSKMTNQFATKP